jgi:hypothetical protein
MVAAFEKHDTGFVGELWNQFGADQHHRLALSLGELDWRLTHNNGPDVMARVWDAIRDRLKTPYCSRLCSRTRPTRTARSDPASSTRLSTRRAAATPR